MKFAMNGKAFRANYDKVKSDPGKLWEKIKGVKGKVYTWPKSTYIAEPPFFEDFTMEPKALDAGVQGARIMGLFGDSHHHRPHLARPAASRRPRRPASTCWTTAC